MGVLRLAACGREAAFKPVGLAAGRVRDADFAALAGFAFLRADGEFFCPVSLAMPSLKEVHPPARSGEAERRGHRAWRGFESDRKQ
jgi:hypothetical protein